MALKFGDIVRNKWASDNNPQKILMVRHNGSRYVHCISRRGKLCKFTKDKDLRLKKLSTYNFDRWDELLENHNIDDYR